MCIGNIWRIHDLDVVPPSSDHSHGRYARADAKSGSIGLGENRATNGQWSVGHEAAVRQDNGASDRIRASLI